MKPNTVFCVMWIAGLVSMAMLMQMYVLHELGLFQYTHTPGQPRYTYQLFCLLLPVGWFFYAIFNLRHHWKSYTRKQKGVILFLQFLTIAELFCLIALPELI